MSYTTNPSLPKVRQQAADLVRRGWSARKVGRYLGFHHTAVMKWVREAKHIGYHPIPTRSSRPKHHPKQPSDDLVWKIFHKRIQIKRCADVVYEELKNEGVSIKRLREAGLVGTQVIVGGIIEDAREVVTKKGERMVFLKFADFTGTIEVVVFPRSYSEYKNMLLPDKCVAIKGRLSDRNDELSLITEAVKEL